MSLELMEQPTSQNQPKTFKAPYQAIVLNSQADFDAVATQWDGFMQEAEMQNLCMTHAWLSTWLRHFSVEKIHIVIIQDTQGHWMGVAPLKISRSRNGLSHRLLRHVQFIGTNPTVFDWMKIAIHPQADENSVLKAVSESLRGERWDLLDLQFLPDQAQAEALCRFLNQPMDTAIRESMSMPYLELPATEADYEKQRRKKTRLEVNRHKNRFEKEFGQPPFLEFQPATEATDAILSRFFSGHIKYWSERGHKSDFSRFPKLFNFYKDLLTHAETLTDPSQPKLMFSVLKVAEHQLSYHLGFWQGDGYLSHITSFNQGFRGYSPGTIHMDALVFASIGMGGKIFDFGRGDEPYKKMWTQTKKPLWNLRIFRNPVSKAIWQVDIRLKKLLGKTHEA
jgi:CelD/BcsL family acetyltransferase involved in cellulose biosynthesis